jgi:hypothetical protein
MTRTILAALAAILALAACGQRPSDPASPQPTAVAQSTDPYLALLEEYHWTPQGAPKIVSLPIPPLDSWNSTGGPPFNLYLAASRTVGLDFTPWAGQTLELRTYLIGRIEKPQHEIYGHLLADQQRVVGAWLSIDQKAPGIYPLSVSLEDLVYLGPGHRPVELV